MPRSPSYFSRNRHGTYQFRVVIPERIIPKRRRGRRRHKRVRIYDTDGTVPVARLTSKAATRWDSGSDHSLPLRTGHPT